MDQILIRILGLIYSLIALPTMAGIAIIYYRKKKTKGGFYFSIGAISTAIGSMFNQLFPIHLFMEQSTGALSLEIKAMVLIASIIHLVGFFLMVIAWVIITFTEDRG